MSMPSQVNIFSTLFPLNILSMFYPKPRCCEQQHIKSTYSQQCPHSTFCPLVINWKLTKLHIRPKPDLINILPTLCLLKICFHVKNLKLGAIITIPRLYQHNSQTLSTPFPDFINTRLMGKMTIFCGTGEIMGKTLMGCWLCPHRLPTGSPHIVCPAIVQQHRENITCY